ncbi:MAG: sulfite exporter TauE/SafE family protein [Ruminococcaceae bacterium]|nr:sulfite exporter TauE/SafE family protein [Oscillospiraceae bacterium]
MAAASVRSVPLLCGGEISAVSFLLPFLCGLAAGTVSAWGVGGGTLLLLAMTLLLQVDHRTAQGINLLFFLPTAASALFCHWKGGFLHKPVLRAAIPPAVLLSLAGAWISTSLNVELLRKPFGIYLLASGTMLLWPQKKKK